SAPGPTPPPVPSAPAGPAPTPRFDGPVVRLADRDLPDPFVLRDGARWWVYATGTGPANLQVAPSPDLATLGPSTDPLPQLPGWAEPGFTWAPAVLPRAGREVLYYSVRDAASGRQCISAAVADTPAGPFVDASTGPMVCQTGNGGSIDPAPFVSADGTAYLLWKSDDNALGTRTRIGGQRLSDDGLSLVGPRPALLSATARWEGGVVEGPAMAEVGGRYYLFYGANHWDTPGAGIGYAVCTSPLGPCVNQSSARAWFATQGPLIGPSGPDPFVDATGRVRLAFHAWAMDAAGHFVRSLWIGTLAFGS
ncbi:MAG TPA: glycoside hydrolase family 43 protein, partial [Acidimicrobiales bacterium]|nr:glycoside hydrolase family 43 protein [Acidimicrobiales bacterium]